MIDSGTLKEVRMIVSRFIKEAQQEDRAMSKLKREEYVPSRRGPGMYIKSGTAQEVAEERVTILRALERDINALNVDTLDMAATLGDMAQLDTVLAEKFPDAYAEARGKVSPVLLAAKILESISPQKPAKKDKTNG
jgi:hypothetical protein